jgi:hypothetical protein
VDAMEAGSWEPKVCELLRWRAFAIEKYRNMRMRGSQLNFVDAFTVFRDWEEQKPDDAAQFIDSREEGKASEFAKSPSTANLVRDLAFAYLRPEQFPTHGALVEQILYNQSGGTREREESDRVGKLLRSWSREGEKGKPTAQDQLCSVREDHSGILIEFRLEGYRPGRFGRSPPPNFSQNRDHSPEKSTIQRKFSSVTKR